MTKKDTLNFECPQCHLPAEAVITEKYSKFIIYTCPKCRSNVVFYGDKIDIISDRLLRKLIVQGKLQSCGRVSFSDRKRSVRVRSDRPTNEPPPRSGPITKDDILNLKIVLETMEDSEDIINNI